MKLLDLKVWCFFFILVCISLREVLVMNEIIDILIMEYIFFLIEYKIRNSSVK